MNNKYIELAKKIKNLADKGEGGEKINAEKLLDDILKKHNIKLEELDSLKLEDFFFNIEDLDFKLWLQIVKKVNNTIKIYGKFDDKTIKKNLLDGNYLISCTYLEYVEIVSMFDFFKGLYNKELDFFFTAFCNANNLLIKSSESKSINDLTPEEYKDFIRMLELSKNIKKDSFRKQIDK
jgi:hypothetical protein